MQNICSPKKGQVESERTTNRNIDGVVELISQIAFGSPAVAFNNLPCLNAISKPHLQSSPYIPLTIPYLRARFILWITLLFDGR